MRTTRTAIHPKPIPKPIFVQLLRQIQLFRTPNWIITEYISPIPVLVHSTHQMISLHQSTIKQTQKKNKKFIPNETKKNIIQPAWYSHLFRQCISCTFLSLVMLYTDLEQEAVVGRFAALVRIPFWSMCISGIIRLGIKHTALNGQCLHNINLGRWVLWSLDDNLLGIRVCFMVA